MKRTLLLSAALFLGASASAQVERLDSGQQPVVADFQEGKGRARLIAILSPT